MNVFRIIGKQQQQQQQQQSYSDLQIIFVKYPTFDVTGHFFSSKPHFFVFFQNNNSNNNNNNNNRIMTITGHLYNY